MHVEEPGVSDAAVEGIKFADVDRKCGPVAAETAPPNKQMG